MTTTKKWGLLLIIIFLSQSVSVSAKPKNTWHYDVEPLCGAVGADGTYLIKVWSYTKKSKASDVFEVALKNAVHGIVFRGFSGKCGVGTQNPMVSSAVEIEKKTYFDSFFSDGGKYLEFVSISGDGIAAEDRIKVGKEYRIGVVVSVKKDALRKELENAGIIKKLGGGFL